MPRGKRDVSKTRRILQKVLEGRPFKQIAFEEHVGETRISFLKARYLSENKHLTLNEKGVKLMNEEQLFFNFSSPPIHRVFHHTRRK